MQVSPVMWWRSWAKKEFASSRSIGRIDSSRERIWRRADGTDEERRRLVIESLGAGRNSKSPRADCLGLRTSLLTPCRTKNRVCPTQRVKSRENVSNQGVARANRRATNYQGGGGFLRALRDHQFPHLDSSKSQGASTDFYTREPCLSKVISRSVNVSNVYNPCALHFITQKDFLYYGN